MHGADGWRLLDQLSAQAQGYSVTRKPILPNAEEMTANPRSRSAKLRVFQRAGGPDDDDNGKRGTKRQRYAAIRSKGHVHSQEG